MLECCYLQGGFIRKWITGTFLLTSLLLFQGCGNVAITQGKSESQSVSGPGPSPAPAPAPSPAPAIDCVRTATHLNTLIDIQLPAGKIPYNNYFTTSLVLGEDLLILTDFTYGNPITSGQPVTGAIGSVEAKYVFGDGSGILPVNMPSIAGYTWNSQAGNAPAWCYVAGARSNLVDKAFIMVYCTSTTVSVGFSSHLLKFDKPTKQFTEVTTSKSLLYGVTSFTSQEEPLYVDTLFDSALSKVTYQVYKISAGGPVKVGPAVDPNTFNGFSLSNPMVFEDAKGKIILNLSKNNNDEHAFYSVLDGQLLQSNWSRKFREVLQFPDSLNLMYYSFDWGPGVINSLFSVDKQQYVETKMSDDNRYIYGYQALIRNTVVKVGMDYYSSIGRAWISYDAGLNFSEVQNMQTQANQIVQTKSGKFYLIGVDKYTSQVKASVYRLPCQE